MAARAEREAEDLAPRRWGRERARAGLRRAKHARDDARFSWTEWCIVVAWVSGVGGGAAGLDVELEAGDQSCIRADELGVLHYTRAWTRVYLTWCNKVAWLALVKIQVLQELPPATIDTSVTLVEDCFQGSM